MLSRIVKFSGCERYARMIGVRRPRLRLTYKLMSHSEATARILQAMFPQKQSNKDVFQMDMKHSCITFIKKEIISKLEVGI